MLPAERKVTVTQPLEDVEVPEEGRACFSCELSHEDEEVDGRGSRPSRRTSG